MTHRHLPFLFVSLLVALSACTTKDGDGCDEGFTAEGDVCVPADAGTDTDVPDTTPDADAGPDMTPDLGPCGEVCTGATPVCNTTLNTCAQCQVGADCAALPERPMCNDAGSCVQCLGNADCTDPSAPVCGDNGTCAPCTVGENAGCNGIENGDGDALGICADVEGTATCVECTADDESACDANVCDVLNQTCTDTPMRMTGLCRECVSSRQCNEGQVCAQDPRGGDDAPFVCLWDEAAPEGPAGACSTAPPFNDTRPATPLIDGTTATVCARSFASCAAASDHRSGGRGGVNCSDDSQCGLDGVTDGRCRRQDAASMRCTIQCSPGSNDDCILDGTQYSCVDTGISPRTCNFSAM